MWPFRGSKCFLGMRRYKEVAAKTILRMQRPSMELSLSLKDLFRSLFRVASVAEIAARMS